MDIQTHQGINPKLCGTPTNIAADFARVELRATADMAVDASGLTHGGFIFGVADHAAMLAVNHPNVVLAGSEVRFLKPVKTGETIIAEARIIDTDGKKRTVTTEVFRNSEKVFTGRFDCFVPDKHVLER